MLWSERTGNNPKSRGPQHPLRTPFDRPVNQDSPSKQTRAELLLRETLSIVTPLVGALIEQGVTYSQFAQALKQAFLDAAREALQRQDKRITDSALSLLSGVHRKDVRAMAHRTAGRSTPARALSIASQVFARWSRDSAYLDNEGNPLPLPVRTRAGQGPSFEQLTRSVSKDFHSRSVLDELLRLGLAEMRGDLLHLKADSFVPQQGFEELLLSISANAHDFMAATMGNLANVGSGRKAPFIERSVFEDRLSDQSVAALRELTASIWRRAAKQVYDAAAQHVLSDAAQAPQERHSRMRFGIYFYSEPVAGAPEDESAGDAAAGDPPGEH